MKPDSLRFLCTLGTAALAGLAACAAGPHGDPDEGGAGGDGGADTGGVPAAGGDSGADDTTASGGQTAAGGSAESGGTDVSGGVSGGGTGGAGASGSGGNASAGGGSPVDEWLDCKNGAAGPGELGAPTRWILPRGGQSAMVMNPAIYVHNDGNGLHAMSTGVAQLDMGQNFVVTGEFYNSSDFEGMLLCEPAGNRCLFLHDDKSNPCNPTTTIAIAEGGNQTVLKTFPSGKDTNWPDEVWAKFRLERAGSTIRLTFPGTPIDISYPLPPGLVATNFGLLYAEHGRNNTCSPLTMSFGGDAIKVRCTKVTRTAR